MLRPSLPEEGGGWCEWREGLCWLVMNEGGEGSELEDITLFFLVTFSFFPLGNFFCGYFSWQMRRVFYLFLKKTKIGLTLKKRNYVCGTSEVVPRPKSVVTVSASPTSVLHQKNFCFFTHMKWSTKGCRSAVKLNFFFPTQGALLLHQCGWTCII